MTDTSQGTLGQGKDRKNLQDIQKHLKDGSEPVELLHGLVSSPLIDLQHRGLAKILSAKQDGKKVVLAILYEAEWVEGKGIVGSK